jgi:hypothetical protein
VLCLDKGKRGKRRGECGLEGGWAREHTLNDRLLDRGEVPHIAANIASLVDFIPAPLESPTRLSLIERLTGIGGRSIVDRLLRLASGSKMIGTVTLSLLFKDFTQAIEQGVGGAADFLHEEFHVGHLGSNGTSNLCDSLDLHADVLRDSDVVQLLDLILEHLCTLPPFLRCAGSTDKEVLFHESEVINGYFGICSDGFKGGSEVVEVLAHNDIVLIHADGELVLKTSELLGRGDDGSIKFEGSVEVNTGLAKRCWGRVPEKDQGTGNDRVANENHHNDQEEVLTKLL